MRKSKSKAITQQDKHDIIDIANSITQAQATNVRYVCKVCKPEQLLLPYPQAQLHNPHAGPSYICPACNKIYDLSLEKLPKAAKRITGTIVPEIAPFIESIDENAGVQSMKSDYDRYNPEPEEEATLKAMGATLIESKIELTDSAGHNRTLVKRTQSQQL